MPVPSDHDVMCAGPGSCIIGIGYCSGQLGRDVKSSRLAQLAFRSSIRLPPPWMCAPPETRRPLSGIVKSDVRTKLDAGPPVPGTVKIGSAWQLTTSSHTGFTEVRDSPVTYRMRYCTCTVDDALRWFISMYTRPQMSVPRFA